MELEEHYGRLLGVNSPWEICHIELKVEDQRLDIWIEYTDDEGSRPECGETCPRYDTRKERSWRHLDTMQFATHLHCEVPQVRCKKHGVRSLSVLAHTHRGRAQNNPKPRIARLSTYSAPRYVRKPKDFLDVSFALVLKPSTTPLESCPLARNQFSNRVRWLRNIRATSFIGSIFDRIVFLHHLSRNRPSK